jgi:hypothetical protein
MTSMSADSYPAARPTGTCTHSGTPITPGQTYVATLAELEEEEGFERLDFSLDAWEQGARPKRLLGFWRAVQPSADEKPKPFIDDEILMDLFEQLENTEDQSKLSFRFLLGLVLLRKRLIREVGRHTTNNQRTLLIKQRGSAKEQEPLHLIDPGMDESAVEQATTQFSAILRGEQ